MATTSQIYAPIFRVGINDLPIGGAMYSFPVSSTQFLDISSQGLYVNDVLMNASITLQAPGLNQLSRVFYTTYTLTNLNNYANGTVEPTTTTTTAAPTTTTTTTAP
jgi:hypothetical protein